jgi:hypothetical protein
MRLQNPGTPVEWINVGPAKRNGFPGCRKQATRAAPPRGPTRTSASVAGSRPDAPRPGAGVYYGMNDGIYFPYGADRAAQRSRTGCAGLISARSRRRARRVHSSDAADVRFRCRSPGRTLPAGRDRYPQPYGGLRRGSGALLGMSSIAQRSAGWEVVDVHGPMRQLRGGTPATRSQGSRWPATGCMPSAQGHWIIAREVLRTLGRTAAVVQDDTPNTLLKWRPEGPGGCRARGPASAYHRRFLAHRHRATSVRGCRADFRWPKRLGAIGTPERRRSSCADRRTVPRQTVAVVRIRALRF